VASVVERCRSGLEKGGLLNSAADRFDVFLTAAQNIQYPQ